MEQDHGIRVSIIPNPNDGDFVLDITSENPGKFSIEITDLTGRVVVERKEINITSKLNIDISIPLAKDGVYLLKLKSEENLLVEKVLVFN